MLPSGVGVALCGYPVRDAALLSLPGVGVAEDAPFSRGCEVGPARMVPVPFEKTELPVRVVVELNEACSPSALP